MTIGNSDHPLYMATVLHGCERIAEDEMHAKIPLIEQTETLRGKILFHTGHSENLLTLRCVDNLYVVLHRFRVGPHKVHLRDVVREIEKCDADEAVRRARENGLLDILPEGRSVQFYVNASRAGKHSYSRFDAADAAMEGVLARHAGWEIGTSDGHDVEFRLDILEGQAIWSLRLTSSSFRFRGDDRRFAQAALRPTVAHSLIWLSRPEETDCFVDPFCGSGTILSERASYGARFIRGGDIDEEAVRAARTNVNGLEVHVDLWDARELPLDSGSVNKVVTNVPFGKQILDPGSIGDLYVAFTRELKRILSPDGFAILLTDQVEALQQATHAGGLLSEPVLQLSLKGLHPHVFRISRAQ